MSMIAQTKLRRALRVREDAGTLRAFNPMPGIDFSSNDYLGLAALALDIKPQSSGATGSRLITGHNQTTSDLENYIADFHGFEDALLFASGYAANTGLLACLGTADDIIISDELVHASMIDGIRLSYAARARFKHNDLADLEAQLVKYFGQVKGQIYVAVEALYSMDGDIAPLAQIAALCQKFGAALIVDEAHSHGVYGDCGQGLVAQFGLQDKVFAVIYTFGKAVGLHGAVICGSNILKDYLINFCRTFIYTTAPSPMIVSATLQAYQRLKDANIARDDLKNIIQYFSDKSQSLNLKSSYWLQSTSPIQGLMVQGNHRAKALAHHLQQQGFAVKAILSPTVPEGQERLRISLHSFNTGADIDALLETIQNWHMHEAEALA